MVQLDQDGAREGGRSFERFADPVVGEGGVLQGRLDLRHVAGGAGLCADGTGGAWVI